MVVGFAIGFFGIFIISTLHILVNFSSWLFVAGRGRCIIPFFFNILLPLFILGASESKSQ